MKILHLTHHSGCLADIEYITTKLGHNITSVYYDKGYNISHDLANSSWQEKKDIYNSYDVVITSDTAPLSRIFLQNMDEFKGFLIVWICNRFDFCDKKNNSVGFPDKDYYSLLRKSLSHPRVKIIPNTEFDCYHTRRKNINVENFIIKPIGKKLDNSINYVIPKSIPEKKELFFIKNYHNDTIFVDLEAKCKKLGIPAYRFKNRHGGTSDIADFKGIIHIPYAWSTWLFFENLQAGIPYFIPSRKFLLRISIIQNILLLGKIFKKNFWFQNYYDSILFNWDRLKIAEWYCAENSDVLVYFDSWNDLVEKINNTDFRAQREKIKAWGEKHTTNTLQQWENVFDGISPLSN